jgi:hypothetical protein
LKGKIVCTVSKIIDTENLTPRDIKLYPTRCCAAVRQRLSNPNVRDFEFLVCEILLSTPHNKGLLGSQVISDWIAYTTLSDDRIQLIPERKWRHICRSFDNFNRHVADFLSLLSSRFCCYTNGLVGVVPQYGEAGDIAFIPQGSHVPFLLRPSTGNSESFRLISMCYVHGMMHGEAFRDERFPTHIVIIC